VDDDPGVSTPQLTAIDTDTPDNVYHRVYNLGEEAVSSYVMVTRTKYGKWIIPTAAEGAGIIAFELREELVQFSGDIVEAALGVLDADTCGITYPNCDTNTILVADLNDVGHTAGEGGRGHAFLRSCTIGTVYEIIDLCCPGEEQGVCNSTGTATAS
jgi:hypothetical protein